MSHKRIDEIRKKIDERQVEMLNERLKAAFRNDKSHTERLSEN